MRPLRGRCSSCRRWGRWLRLRFRKEDVDAADVVDVGKMTFELAALFALEPAHRAWVPLNVDVVLPGKMLFEAVAPFAPERTHVA